MYCKVTDQIIHIMRMMDGESKRPHVYGGVSLSLSEITFLESVVRYPGENVSGISQKLGITKGAVTQMVGKLDGKRLIKVQMREDNKKEKYLYPTETGTNALRAYQADHEAANRKLCAFIGSLNQEETRLVHRFLECIQECVPFSEFECMHVQREAEGKTT